MYPHDFSLENAKLLQKQILDQCVVGPELELAARGTESDLAEQNARRRFFRAYQIRSFLFRLAPRLAARLVL